MICIYALCCPKSGEPRYIGQAKNLQRRLLDHIRKSSQHPSPLGQWLRSLMMEGRVPRIKAIRQLANDADANAAEIEMIRSYREAGHQLLNLTIGGAGLVGLPASVLKRRSDAFRHRMADPVRKAAWRAAVKKARQNPEVRKKMSAAQILNWSDPQRRMHRLAAMRTPEAIANRSRAARERFADPKVRADHAAKMAEVWSRPQARKEQSKRTKESWANPEIRAERIASLRETYATPEMKAKMSVVNSEINSRPEVLAKRSQFMKDNWADSTASSTRREALASDEVRSRMSESAKKRWSDPEKSKTIRERFASEETRLKKAEAARRRATPEYRASMAEKTRQSWIRRRQG